MHGFGFAVSFPFVSERLRETVPTESRISIPKDEPTETIAESEPLVSETVEESHEETQVALENEFIEKAVRKAMGNYRYTVEDLNALFSSLRHISIFRMSF